MAPPAWLNGQTMAIVSTVLTVGVGIGAMVFAATSSLRGEIGDVRGEIGNVRGEIGDVRSQVDALATRLEDTRKSLSAQIEATRVELRAEIRGLDARLRVVERTVAGIQGRLAVTHPVTQGTSAAGREGDDADA